MAQSITYLVLDHICLVVLFFDALCNEKLVLNENEVLGFFNQLDVPIINRVFCLEKPERPLCWRPESLNCASFVHMCVYLVVGKTDLGHDRLMNNEVLAHVNGVLKFFLTIIINFVWLKEVVLFKVHFWPKPSRRVHQYLQVLGSPVRSTQAHFL